MRNNVDIEKSWTNALYDTLASDKFKTLSSAVHNEYQHATVYPPADLLFTAFALTPIETVKVVILGQDPYHGKDQAHGLAFSVPDDITLPPSLRNIYKEIATDIGGAPRHTGNLTDWAKQGVLLLNSSLTVRAGEPASHQKLNWEWFTDDVIKTVSQQRERVVFMLWGAHAQSKQSLIDGNKHLILTAPHPSPLAAHRGFFGCRHFSICDKYLIQHNQTPIRWTLEHAPT